MNLDKCSCAKVPSPMFLFVQDDEFTHVYTLIVKPDNTYEVKIDNERVEGGELEADWDFLAPKKINDPDAKKPSDWDDRKKIDDENDKKPEVWISVWSCNSAISRKIMLVADRQ